MMWEVGRQRKAVGFSFLLLVNKFQQQECRILATERGGVKQNSFCGAVVTLSTDEK